MGNVKTALQEAAACGNATKYQGDEDHGQGILAREKSHENSGIANADDEGFAGSAVHRRNFYGAGEPCCRAAKETGEQNQPANRQTRHLCRAPIATEGVHCKAQRRVTKDEMQSNTPKEAN